MFAAPSTGIRRLRWVRCRPLKADSGSFRPVRSGQSDARCPAPVPVRNKSVKRITAQRWTRVSVMSFRDKFDKWELSPIATLDSF